MIIDIVRKNKKNIFLLISILISSSLILLSAANNSVTQVIPVQAQSCPPGCYWNGGLGVCTGPGGCVVRASCYSGEFDAGSGYCCDNCEPDCGGCGSCTPSACDSGYTETNTGCATSNKTCTRYDACGSCGTTTRYCYLLKYTLTYSAGAGGTISGTTSQSICRGSNGTQVTAVPNGGYYFVNWSDGIATAARTDTNVTANKSVTANFALSNQAPTAPTSLQTNNATNPVGVVGTPVFRAVFQDPNAGNTATYYQIQVNTNSAFTGTVMWDSAKAALSPALAINAMMPNKVYMGTTLANGTTYYWRIKFWDNLGAEGVWSATGQFTMNTPPTAPTSLQTEAATNPTGVTDTTPEFSAIFQDPNTGNTGAYYEVQVNTNSAFTGTVMWSSGQTAMAATNIGARSPNISYAGTALTLNGTTYYWRIRFTDNYGTVGTWSSTAQFTMNTTPSAPTGLYVNNQTNPTGVLPSPVPQFSAIFQDPNTGDTGTYYEIQVNTNSAFTGTVMWSSGQTSTTSTAIGERSPDISYAGTTLTTDGTTYYWRIRFTDNHGTIGAWSSTATFRMLDVPAAPTELIGEAQSIDTIRWSFKDNATGEDGVRIYDTNDNLMQTCVGEDITYCDEGNLAENTQYTRYAVVYNTEASSTRSNTESKYTLISIPELQVVQKTDTTVSLTSTQPINNGELNFDCETNCSLAKDIWTLENDITVINLANNTQYVFRVKARNGDNIESLYSIPISVYTYASVPQISTGTLSTTSISLDASGVNNLTSGNSGIYFECIGLQCNDGISNWITTTSDVVLNLSPNTQYTFRVKARNYDGDETAYSSNISSYTLATVPSLTDVHSISSSEISIRIHNGENPYSTEIAVQEISGKYVNLSTGLLQDTPDWNINPMSSITVSGLNSSTTYTFRVKARNENNIETDFSLTASATTFISSISALAPTVNSSTQITWNISDTADQILGIRVYAQDGSLIKTCLGSDITSCTESGLDVNTAYTRKLKVYNSISESNFTNEVSATTFANPPILQNITSDLYTNESVKIYVDRNSNPSTTRYILEETTSGKYYNSSTQLLQDTPDYSTYEQLGKDAGFNIYGLQPNTQYSFKSKALNDESVETSDSNTISFVTLASQPAVISVTPVDSTSVKILVNNNGNGPSTLFRIIEVDSGNSIDTTTKKLTTESIWKLYEDFGSQSGIVVGDLQSNTLYRFCVYAKNSQDIQTDCSQIVGTYTYTKTASVSAKILSSTSIELTVGKGNNTPNTRYQLIESVTNNNIDSNGNFINSSTYHDDARVNSNFTLSNLGPNTQYSFRVRTVNMYDMFSSWSDTISVTTWANIPKNLLFEPLTGNSGRISFDRNGNPSSTKFAIQEKNSSKYLSYSTMQLVDTPVWGTYTQWGESRGLIVTSLESGATYTFMAKAINSANVETSYVESNTGNTYSIIVNKPESIKVALVNDSNIDVSDIEGAQTGVQNIRVTDGQYLVADIPISFETNRDWTDAIVVSEPQQGKTVIKLDTSHGLANGYTMYVVKKDMDNSFRICPQAKTLEEVNSNCQGGVLYTGNFPQKKKVEGTEITVSVASVSGVTYWIADGVRGTGAQGEFVEPTIPPVGGNIIQNVSNAVESIVAGAMNTLDQTPLGDLPKEQLTTVSATTTAVTVSVSIFSIFSNFTQFGYTISQIFFNLFSSLGFRRKRYPCGYIYDSMSRNPITQAVVRIYDINKKLVDTGVTDSFGLFRTNAAPGEYILEVKKREYTFPSRLILGKEDYPLSNVYHGEKIYLKENEINIVIPLDPIEDISANRVFTVLRSIFSSLLPVVNIMLFTGGVLIATYVYTKDNSIENIIVLALYLPTLYLLIRNLVGMRKQIGKVVYTDGTVASNITLFLRDTDFNRVISKRVTDSKGRYFFEISEKGNYAIEIVDKNTRIVSGNTDIRSKGRMIVDENLKITRI